MARQVVQNEDEARADVSTIRTRPSWLSCRHALPFQDLSDDEFEVFNYLLLLKEHPGEKIIYYGKTGDSGRDIVRGLSDGTDELIQCKRYSTNVGIGEVREELAKLCFNIFEKRLPVIPSRVVFHVVPDLTAPAIDLISSRARWLVECDAALEKFLGCKPTSEILDFARNWWPELIHEEEHKLTERANRFQNLLNEFFEIRQVVSGSLDEIKPELNSIREAVDNVHEMLETHFATLGAGAVSDRSTESVELAGPGRRVSPQHSPQIQVLTARIGLLEEREQRLLDEKGQRIWGEVQGVIRELSLKRAADSVPQLVDWLEDEGRNASPGTRSKASVLLADLAIIVQTQRYGLGKVDTHEARRWYRRAVDELKTECIDAEAVRLVSLDAKLLSLEGQADEALRRIADLDDPSCIVTRLSILLDQENPEAAIHAVEGKPLHERWCDRLVTAHSFLGSLDRARDIAAWARKHSDAVTHRRCIVALVHGALRRILGNQTGTDLMLVADWSEIERQELGELVDILRPLLKLIEANGQVQSGLEAEALGTGLVLFRLLGDQDSCTWVGNLLVSAQPVSLELARAALRGDIESPEDLPARLCADYAENLDARIIAVLVESRMPGRASEAFEHALDLKELSIGRDQRENFVVLLVELASTAGEGEALRAETASRELLGDSHQYTLLARVSHLIRAGKPEEAIPIIELHRTTNDPYWLQLSAACRHEKGDESGALDDLLAASRVVPRPEVLEQVARIALKLSRHDIAGEVLEKLVRRTPRSVEGWKLSAELNRRLGRHGQTAKCFHALRALEPEMVTNGINEAKSLALSGKRDTAIQVYNSVCEKHPHSLEAVGGRAQLLDWMGHADRAFETLEKVREHFWSDVQFLCLYLSIGYRARREHEASLAFQRLLELQADGREVPLQGFTLDELRSLHQAWLEEHVEYNRALLVGHFPWLVVGRQLRRPSYAEWAHRSQPIIMPDDPHTRAEFAIYSTNGWVIRAEENGGTVLEQSEGCPPPGQPVVADVSALISLHRLGMLDHAARYFGKILIPSDYSVLALKEQPEYLHHQPLILDQIRTILEAVGTGRLRTSPSMGGYDLPLLEEHADGPFYRLVDVASWLHGSGVIADEELAELKRSLKGETRPDLRPIVEVIGNGLETRLLTLQTAISSGIFANLVERVQVYLPSTEVEVARGQLLTVQRMSEIGGWHHELWDLVLSDARFEQSEPPAVNDPPVYEGQRREPDLLLLAPLLALERKLPLLTDDRFFQLVLLNDAGGDCDRAFGTDRLLQGISAKGIINPEEFASNYLQLMKWRYRFLIPPPEVLLTLAARHKGNSPGEPLRDVARYLHDCMRDAGLISGIVPTSPPCSPAWKTMQFWLQSVGRFVVQLWNDDRFDEPSARALTRWAAGELLPSAPTSLPRAAMLVANGSVPDIAFMTAFATVWNFKNAERANRALREIASALRITEERYVENVETLLETTLTAPMLGKREEEVVHARRVCAGTAFMHLDTDTPRSVLALQRFGFVEEALLPEASTLEAIRDPSHVRRVQSPPGAIVFLMVEGSQISGEYICVTDLFLSPSLKVREVSLKYFASAPEGPETWLSPTGRIALKETASDLLSDVPQRWLPAAKRLSLKLEEDFLLNLATLGQTLRARLTGEQPRYWRRVLHPGQSLFSSIPVEWYDLPSKENLPLIEPLSEPCGSLEEALDRYVTRYGHLCLVAPLSAGSLVRAWLDSHEETDNLWDRLRSWAGSVSNSFRHFHAFQILLENPSLVPAGKLDELWAGIRTVFAQGSDESDARGLDTISWQLRTDLARHYYGESELHAVDADRDRLAALAWWTAERFARMATDIVLPEGMDHVGMARCLRNLLEQTVSPEADMTACLWGLARPPGALTSFAFGTMEIRSIWGVSLLSSVVPVSRPEAGIPPGHVADTVRVILGACFAGFPWPISRAGGSILAVDVPPEKMASYWSTGLRNDEELKILESASEVAEKLRDGNELRLALERLPRSNDVEKPIICNTFRAACTLGQIDSTWVWELLSDEEWLKTSLLALEPSHLHSLCWGLIELQR